MLIWQIFTFISLLIEFETISHFQVVVKVAPVNRELSWCPMNEIQNNFSLKKQYLEFY